MGIDAPTDETSKLADQLIKRYMLATTESDLAKMAIGHIFGGDKAADLEHKLDINIKRRELGLPIDTSGLGADEDSSSLPFLAGIGSLKALASKRGARTPLQAIFKTATLAEGIPHGGLGGGGDISGTTLGAILRGLGKSGKPGSGRFGL